MSELLDGTGSSHFRTINTSVLKRINRVYTKEKYFIACSKVIKQKVFEGGISKVFAEKFQVKSKKKQELDLEYLETIFEKAIDYQIQFGFAPVVAIRDKLDPLNVVAYIPDYDSGKFLFKQITPPGKVIVKFVYNGEHSSLDMLSNRDDFLSRYLTKRGKKAAGLNRHESPDGVDPSGDDNRYYFDVSSTFVFVWPNMEPTSDGKLKSQVFSVLEEHDRVLRGLSNEDQAEYILTHPTVFTEHLPTSGSMKMEDLTEPEYFAEKTVGQALEQSTYQRDIETAENDEKYVQNQINMRGDNGKTTTNYMDSDRQEISKKEFKTMDGKDVVPLRMNRRIGRQIVPSFNPRLDNIIDGIGISICLIMGIPKSFLVRDKTYKTDGEQEIDNITTHIKDKRKVVTQFYEFIYSITDMCSDDLMIKDMISELNERKYEDLHNLIDQFGFNLLEGKKVAATKDDESGEDDGDDGDRYTTKRTKRKRVTKEDVKIREADVMKIADRVMKATYKEQKAAIVNTYGSMEKKMNNMLDPRRKRVKIEFNKEPFERLPPVQEVELISKTGSISKMEEVNIYRKMLALKPISEQEINKNVKEVLEFTKKMVEASIPPQPEGEDGGPSSGGNNRGKKSADKKTEGSSSTAITKSKTPKDNGNKKKKTDEKEKK